MSYRIYLISVLVIGLITVQIHGEDPPTRRAPYPPMVEKIQESLSQLSLNPDQKTRTDAILSDAAAQIVKLRSQANGDMANFREDAAHIFTQMRNKLAEVLSPDQMKQLQESMPRRFNPPAENSTPPTPPPMMGGMDEKAGNIQMPKNSPTTAPAEEKLKVGQPAPDFKLKRPDGKSYSLSNFKGKPTVLLFGSITSPTFRARVMSFEELKQDYRNKANVVIIYTREAYPANEWEVQRNVDDQVTVNQPSTIEERNKLAQQTRDAAKFSIDILVDDMDDGVATSYDAIPNGCVLIDASGNVVFKQKWADAWGMRGYLDSTLKAR